MNQFTIRETLRKAISYVLTAGVASSAIPALSATTDIANAPLVTSSTASVLPNVFLMMDDSGSMSWTHMPDDSEDGGSSVPFKYGFYGLRSSQCNGVYYNPNTRYYPPFNPDGTSFPDASFTAAKTNGFNASSSTVNLSTSFRAGDFSSFASPRGGDSTGSAAYYYVYSGVQTSPLQKQYYDTAGIFFKECGALSGDTTAYDGTRPVNTIFTKVTVGASSGPGATDERTNFANWYSYYRTRMLMMKSATGIAFKAIDSRFRVGFASMNNNGGSDLVNIDTFDATQKTAFYNKLYATSANSGTPLRVALSNAGRLYAKKLSTLNSVTVRDPVQYSCQQNFTILTTDGFWNGAAGFKLDGSTAVGNQDSSEARPFFDGFTPNKTKVVTTTVTTSPSTRVNYTTTTTTIDTTTTQPQTVTTPYNRNQTTVSATKNCTTSAAVNPTTSPTDNGQNTDGSTRKWYITSSVTGQEQCTAAIGGGGIFACRGNTSTQVPPTGTPCKADNAGTIWCVYPNNFTSGTSLCTRVATSNSLYYCRAAAQTNGFTVSVQPQRYNRVAQQNTVTTTRQINTSTNNQTTVTNSISTNVVTTIDGTVTSNTTTPSTTTVGPTASTVNTTGMPIATSGPTTTTLTDTGAPGVTTTWTNNGAATSTCQASPANPAGSITTSAPIASVASTVNGTASSTPVTTTGSSSGSTTTVGTPTTTTNSVTTTVLGAPGTSNTLADVAEYYYVTDLRDSSLGNQIGALGNDISANEVVSTANDFATWQHMTTFTLGLGARGRMNWSPTYQTDTSGDYYSVLKGLTANSATGICRWQANGTICNWPVPTINGSGEGGPENLDDLWHAAVNGRGSYFGATDPVSVAAGLVDALTKVGAKIGASAAAATSSPNITSGDNFVFLSTFRTVEWSGELTRNKLDANTAQPDPVADWSARDQLELNASRTLYMRNSTLNTLKLFDWSTMTAAEKLNFTLPNIGSLSQFCILGPTCLSTTDQAAAEGQNLVDFLRGVRTNEGVTSDVTKYYRQRAFLLGDIVSAEANYVQAPRFTYADTGYAAFASSKAMRPGTVYVAANDGFLHAFDSATGNERWAYVPTFVLPNMFKLADKGYSSTHSYFVDGSPVTGDAFFGGTWHTILVGGQNAGGRGYYALDVTDPLNPVFLWEFTNTNLGFTYGNPKITKLNDGTWVVLLASGYNNVTPGDGVGRLFVLNAQTGALIRTISTATGSTTTPSGLSKIETYVASANTNNTAIYVYGGDLLGNVWRFDINGGTATRLITLVDAGGVPQPLTARPVIAQTGGQTVVLVGTGQLLGVSDLVTTQQQSFYAIKDTFSATALGNPRVAGNKFVKQTQSITTCTTAQVAAGLCSTGQLVRNSTNNVVNFATDNGWYLDLPASAERANTDPTLILGELIFNTNVPGGSACSIGGDSFEYFLDYRTGGPISSALGVTGVKLGSSLATSVKPLINTGAGNPSDPSSATGQIKLFGFTRLGSGDNAILQLPPPPTLTATRRVSWRELTD